MGAWKFWDLRAGNRSVIPLIGGAATGVLLLLPFLVGLTNGTQEVHFELVPPDARAPILQFLIVWWPLLVLVAAILLAGQRRSLPGFLAILFLTLLATAEVFNVRDGSYSGESIRFNPVLKWWGWIFTGGVFSLSAFLLAGTWRVGRIVAATVLVLISVYAIDVGRFLIFRFQTYPGIDGTGYYRQNPSNGRMLRYLEDAPPGIVLEKVYEDSPMDTGIYAGFAAKPSVVGVPYLLNVWKKGLTELPRLGAEVKTFYAGIHPQAARFLADNDVRYVVWSVRESRDNGTWRAITDALAPDYRWMEFSSEPDAHIGLWIKR